MRLISFEGIDGSGKTTIAEQVAQRLQESGKRVILLREPGTTEMGLALRTLLKSDTPRGKLTEILMFMAARAELVENVITNNKDADYILLDRYVDSTTVYQGYGNGYDMATIDTLNQIATQGHLPDTVFYIRTELETAEQRRKLRQDDVDKFDNDKEFAKRVFDGYERLKTRSNVVTIDNTILDETVKQVLNHL